MFADSSDVARAAKDMNVDMLMCRDFGHPWVTRHINRYRDYFERLLVCPRCHSKAAQQLGRDGTVLGRRYEYAEGYLFVGLGRLDAQSKGVLRLTIFDNLEGTGIMSDMEPDAGRRKKSRRSKQ